MREMGMRFSAFRCFEDTDRNMCVRLPSSWRYSTPVHGLLEFQDQLCINQRSADALWFSMCKTIEQLCEARLVHGVSLLLFSVIIFKSAKRFQRMTPRVVMYCWISEAYITCPSSTHTHTHTYLSLTHVVSACFPPSIKPSHSPPSVRINAITSLSVQLVLRIL